MADKFSPQIRSKIMSCIRSKNTKPEILVRKWLHKNGYRFRLHSKKLPGKPDIILPKYKLIIFVNGCFWHNHDQCKNVRFPSTNREYWINKINNNSKRDIIIKNLLEELGWNVIIIWECEVKNKTFINKLNDVFISILKSH